MSELGLRKYGHWSRKGWLVEILCSWHRIRYRVVEKQRTQVALAQVGEATGPPGGLFHPLVGLSACQPGPSGVGEDAEMPREDGAGRE